MTPDAPTPRRHTERAQPESFRAVSLQASLTVKDLTKSVAWYRDVIGFVIDKEYERDGRVFAVALKAGAVRILVNQDDGGKGLDRPKGEGFSLMLTTTQSVDEVAKRIKAADYPLTTEPTDMPWGARAFRVQDPDGFKFAISSERAPS
jgi:uncharacterized glyoxalase superfamily protein PhnB